MGDKRLDILNMKEGIEYCIKEIESDMEILRKQNQIDYSGFTSGYIQVLNMLKLRFQNKLKNG